MSEGEATAECEACAKASEEWLRGDYPDEHSTVAALMDANQRAHHAEIAALRAEVEEAARIMRLQHESVVAFQSKVVGLELRRCLKGEAKNDCAVEDFLGKYEARRRALKEVEP